MFFFGRPRVRALFHVEAHNVADVRMWAFCIGFRNLLAGIGAIVGLGILWTGDEAVGRAVVVTGLCYTCSSRVSLWASGSARTLATPRRKRARHRRIEPAAAGRPLAAAF